MKLALIITLSALLSLNLAIASGDAETLAEKIEMAQDADSTITELEQKLLQRSDNGQEYVYEDQDGFFSVPAEESLTSQPLRRSARKAAGAPPSVVNTMERQLREIQEMTAKLKAIKDDSFQEKEVADWNAMHDRIKALLFQVLSNEEHGEISDDLAPVLEEIRKEFQIDIAELQAE